MKRKLKQGVCANFDSCELASMKLVQETEVENFVCAECGSRLIPYKEVWI